MDPFIARHADKIRGVFSCFDRVVLTGTLPDLCHADAMARLLGARQIRLFDSPRWAEPFRDTIRTHAEPLARDNGLTIEFIRRLKAFRKEERIKAIKTGTWYRQTRPVPGTDKWISSGVC